MRRYLTIFFLLLTSVGFSQLSLKDLGRSSREIFVYKINAADAEKYIGWDSIPVSKFIDLTPAYVFPSYSLYEDSLPIGLYVSIGAFENKLKTGIINRSDIVVLNINNKQQQQIDIRSRLGGSIAGCRVFVGNKEAVFNNDSKTYWIRQRTKEGAMVKVYAASDTAFVELEENDDARYTIPEQRRRNYRSSRVYKILNWIPDKISHLFSPRKNTNGRIGASGYIIFNQPKYKPQDTVRLKGYVVDKKWNRYKKPVHVYLSYYSKGGYKDQFITVLKPSTPGSYIGEMALADTLPLDIKYTISFETADRNLVIRETFKIEDYLLDEVGEQNFRTSKNEYYGNDSLYFFASAKDANGLNVLDVKARLLLIEPDIKRMYKDTVLVADTLYDREVAMATDGDTKFVISSTVFPIVDLNVTAKLIFRNANNEQHEKTTNILYKYRSREIVLKQENDSIKFSYIENGVSKEADGEFEMNDELISKVHFPGAIKIDPIAEDFDFYIYRDDTLHSSIEVASYYRVQMNMISRRDTLGFILDNPYQIPVYYTLFDGKKIVLSGKQSDKQITWTKVMSNHRKVYKLRWQYIWQGREHQYQDNLGLLYKMLDIKISNNRMVFPGQKDSMQIDVVDYKGRPAEKVNLTAVSYNNQFRKDIRLPNPPYLAKYIPRHYLERNGYMNDGVYYMSKTYLLGWNKEWIRKFGLDSMTYYKLLFPENGIYDATTPLQDGIPQLSIYATRKGVVQKIYLLYINNELVYYSGVTDHAKYAFPVLPEHVRIGIRLQNMYIDISDLYIQPYYKHDISVDIDNLPGGSKILPMGDYLSGDEISLLERSLWQVQLPYSFSYSQQEMPYVWQGQNLVRISNYGNRVAGPFREYDMTYFQPGNFDINFRFEPGYLYGMSKQALRLEKKSLFPYRKEGYLLDDKNEQFLKLGDTIVPAPEIAYPVKKSTPFIFVNNEQYNYAGYAKAIPHTGVLQINLDRDSSIRYIILRDKADSSKRIILESYYNRIKNLPPAVYSCYVVTRNFYTAEFPAIVVRENTITCIKADSIKYHADNPYLEQLSKDEMIPNIKAEEKKEEPVRSYLLPSDKLYVTSGGGILKGKISDAVGGKPIPYGTVVFKGFNGGVQSNVNGEFYLGKIRPGRYIVVITQAGYNAVEMPVLIVEGNSTELRVIMEYKQNSLKEVIVTSAFNVKRSTSSSVTVMANSLQLSRESMLNDALAGKVSGIVIRSQSSAALGRQNIITLRGENGVLAAGEFGGPVVVIDGIIYKEMPKDFDVNLVEGMTVLNAESAIALFGPEASNGAIVITTKLKTLRQQFRDYALWAPNFFTDKNGHAAVEVTFPDNVTGWKTYVVAMDKKRRIGTASTFTMAYKPLLAELGVPQFLLEGDSVSITGKSLNYTENKYTVSTGFSLNGQELSHQQIDLVPKDAIVNHQVISVNEPDTVSVSFFLQSTTGFKDAEEKKIPVLRKGIEETIGSFWILKSDSAVSFNALPGNNNFDIYAENNTLSVLLDELDHLRKYPYFCMEQTASKLSGLAMEKKIRARLKQPFNGQKTFDKLLHKVQKSQLFEGGWAWWENGRSNLHITNYITRVLLEFREDPLVQTNINNAFSWLHNQLPVLNRNELLACLSTLSEGGYQLNYDGWMSRINFDSLSTHQQWQWVSIRQQQKLDYQQQLKILVNKNISTMLGGMHWGEENYYWYSNEIATTVLAFNVLKNEKSYKDLLPSIIQYFLEKRKPGHWRNTIESASILNSILPVILEQDAQFNEPVALTISGDTNLVVKNFPFHMHKENSMIRNLEFRKSGGGLIYLTAYQQVFNPSPGPVEDKFVISTSFQKNNETFVYLKAGEKFRMLVSVNVLKDADYVMMEVPIPAGCTYADRSNNNWRYYKEFYKDRMLLFTEFMNKGVHNFEIELVARYSGTYTLNPTRVELMYYPVFYGRNGMRRIQIIK